MKFPKPYFKELRHHFLTEPGSVHICPRGLLSGSPSASETSGMRMSEALVLAARLVPDRAGITDATPRTAREGPLLAAYGFQSALCPHGLAREAADLAYFLEEHWGKPAMFYQVGSAPDRLQGHVGVAAFIGVEGQLPQGHIDLWDKSGTLGPSYWGADKSMFWSLD